MNARTPFPANSKPFHQSVRPRRDDMEFLPAALEILETPPSPIRIAFLWTICLFVVAALAWSWFGRIDVVAVAQGKIQPAGRVKVIQPLETGRVASLAVENGRSVRQGEVLVALDSGEADADVAQIEADLSASQAEAARRRAAVAALDKRDAGSAASVPAILWPDEADGVIPDAIRRRESAVLAGDLAQLASARAGLEAQLSQKQRESERYTSQVAALGDLVATLQSRVDMRTSLTESGSGSKADLIDAMETLQEQKANLAVDRGQIAESQAAIEVFARQIEDGERKFLAENLQKLADAERKIDEGAQALAKARVRRDHTVLRSPIDGTVSALSITTIGQVIGAGEEVMRIIPQSAGADLEIEAYILNRDIGFIAPGQSAIVKIETLPFTRYGTIEAKLTRVAADAIPEPDAATREGNPAKASSERGLAGAQRLQNLVFPATFQPEAQSLMAEGVAVPLSPGMAVTVEIKTGSRRILEYLFSPLVEVASTSMKER